MDDYQSYIQSGSDDQGTSSGGTKYKGSGGGNIGCGTLCWIVLGVAFLIFWYSNGGT